MKETIESFDKELIEQLHISALYARKYRHFDCR